MKEKDGDIYSNLKLRILSIKLQVEFNMLINHLKNTETLRIFYLRELHGIAQYTKSDSSKFNENFECFLIFPKIKGENLEINDFTIKNINSRNFLADHYLFKIKMMHLEGWENYRKVLFRFKFLNNVSNNNDYKIIVNNKNSYLEPSDFVDLFMYFYIDITDNSTVIVNEFYYDLNEHDFLRFYDIEDIFFKKFKIFFEKNFKIYFCNESILINRSMIQIFNYIMSLKFINNERFEIKDIQKFNDEINIFVDIKDKTYPDSVYQARCHILKLSDISCFVSIISLIDVNYFNISERFTTLKAAIIVVLKLLKKKIEKEIIQS